jgi:AcrR family transcriptional regulator
MSDDPPTAAEQSDATRAKLIAAALEVFLERGYEGTRVQEIARRAGFTTGAIYANFEGKGALLSEAIASQGVAGLDDMVQSLLDDTAAHEVLLRWGMALQSAEPAPVHTLLLEAYAAGPALPRSATWSGPAWPGWAKASPRWSSGPGPRARSTTRSTPTPWWASPRT